MRAPLCICNGVIRSGSTWSFNVCRELYQRAAQVIGQPTRSGYFEPDQLEQFINEHWVGQHRVGQQWVGMDSPVVIKAHTLGPVTVGALRKGSARAVCTFRDPRDCVASDMAFMHTPFEICVKRVSSTFEPLRMFQCTPNILLVKYEQMIINPRPEIERIATHLGLSADESTVNFVHSITNIHNSKLLCESLPRRAVEDVLRLHDHIIDPLTHLHQNHINGGTVGRWKKELTAEQIAYASEFFAPWLIRFGYETLESLQAMIEGEPATDAGIGLPLGSLTQNAVNQSVNQSALMAS